MSGCDGDQKAARQLRLARHTPPGPGGRRGAAVMDDDVTVTHPRHWQGLDLWLGDGEVVVFDDKQVSLPSVRPVQRAVAVARLRAAADLIESAVPA